MALNAIFVPADRPTECGLEFSADPSITVEKTSATTELTAPGTVNYSYLVSNTGNVTINALNLADTNTTLPPVCVLTSLAPGTTTTCTATHDFTQDELDRINGGTLLCPNEAVTFKGLYNHVTATSTETTPATDELCIPVIPTPAMTVDKTSTSASLSAPGLVTYNYLVSNTGNVTITALNLADTNTTLPTV